ncbi:hypothetical protein Q3G72_028013 [Acer saccharum]|nr:hypothetical protein Q3G72_028013 [Acer saccharum]
MASEREFFCSSRMLNRNSGDRRQVACLPVSMLTSMRANMVGHYQFSEHDYNLTSGPVCLLQCSLRPLCFPTLVSCTSLLNPSLLQTSLSSVSISCSPLLAPLSQLGFTQRCIMLFGELVMQNKASKKLFQGSKMRNPPFRLRSHSAGNCHHWVTFKHIDD